VEKYGRIAFVPEALPLAPRPIPGELISSRLLRVSFANGLTLAQLIEAIETRFPGISLQRAFIDDELSPRARSAIAKFLRVPEGKVKAQELAQRFPMLPQEWILRPTEWEPSARERFAQGRARYAFCPLCLQEMIFRARTVWIRSEWAFVFQPDSQFCSESRVTGIPAFFRTRTASDWRKPFCSRQCFRLVISGRGLCGMKV
jgi:TniQ